MIINFVDIMNIDRIMNNFSTIFIFIINIVDCEKIFLWIKMWIKPNAMVCYSIK